MSLTTQLKNQHLLWRAGFGPAVEQIPDLTAFTPQQFFKALVKASEKKPEYIDVADDYLKGLMMGIEEVGRQQKKELTPEERKKVQQKNRDGVRNLNAYWLHEMINSAAQLREKMAFFWHGHFACRNLNVFYQQGLLDILRRNALGNFGTMLKEVSRSAAMLNFLNNQQNKKDHPNENFAREVMELFTLGRGHYTEQDIKEAARAFTGWSATLKGEFLFRRLQHDFGSKTVLGRTGNFDGEEILDILLQEKQTANYITSKIYRFFVNENPDQEKVNWLAARFHKNNYEILPLLEDIFTSDWFYTAQHIGTMIKSPVELIAGIQRMLPMKLDNEEVLQQVQRALGQLLFFPPNVAGWPGGKNWIDSSSLMLRMRIPRMINDTDAMNIRPKDDDDQMMGKDDAKNDARTGKQRLAGRAGKPILADINWKQYVKSFEKISRESLPDAMTKCLLQTNPNYHADLMMKHAEQGSREEFIRSYTIQIMSTPEYQLC